MAKPLTRRLFARQAAIAPLAAETLLQQRAAQPHFVSPALNGAIGSIRGGPDLTEKAFKLLRGARKALEEREAHAGIMGGLDPDILALRSISSSYKARMLARASADRRREDEGLWAWARRQVGLPVEDE